MISLDLLLQPVSFDDARRRIYSLAESLGLKTTNWIPGGVTRALFSIAAALLSAASLDVNTLAAQGFLDTAVQNWLTRLAKVVYGVDRIEATYATGSLTITNSGGGIYAFDPGELIVKNTATGTTYANMQAVTLNPSTTLTDVLFRAQLVGSEGNAAIGQVDTLVTTLIGVDVTNTSAFEGIDEETDEALRVRCRAALGALSPNGPRRAYEYVSLTPDLNGGVSVTRVKVLNPPGTGQVNVILAGPGGTLAPGEVALVQAGLDEWATPEVATVSAIAAIPVHTSYTGTIHVDASAGMLSTEWEALIKSVLVDWTNTIPIGGVDIGAGGKLLWRLRTGIIEEIKIGGKRYVLQAQGDEFDIDIGPTEIAELDPANITLTIVQVTL